MSSHAEPVADFSTAARERRLRLMTWFVRVAGLYNASAIVILMTPGALGLVGVPQPYSAFWTWLAGLIFGLPWALGRTHRELLTNRIAA